MINHGEKCSHCNGHVSEPKPVLAGPRKGQMQAICTKCGHIHYQQTAPLQGGAGVISDTRRI
jgi:hypothetical protein